MKLVIANRGEIARRILRAGRERGYTVAVISTAEDRDGLVCEEASEVLEVSSYLNGAEIVSAAKAWGAQLVHPGYGFLSENAEFAKLVEDANIRFVGPRSENITVMGSKESAKRYAQMCNVPVLNALFSSEIEKLESAALKKELGARGIRAPYLVKASAGGGGRGMRVVENFDDLASAIHRASEEAKASFKDGTVFIENYLVEPRHIEIQVFGDGEGGGVFLGERECSLQRRHQKVIEEAPSFVVSEALREEMGRAALSLVKETKYRGAGTAEFLLDSQGQFFFLEMNTRLQVEHPVTELVYGVDLVHAQFDLAEGHWPKALPSPTEFHLPRPRGVALEARILAEDPRQNFMPTPGRLRCYVEPQGEGIRVDSGVAQGRRVNAAYDSMIAKLIVHGKDRDEAVRKLRRALEGFVVHGATTNIPFLHAVVSHPDFRVARESTSWLAHHLEGLNEARVPSQFVTFFNSQKFIEALTRFWYAPKAPTLVHALSQAFSQIASPFLNPSCDEGGFLRLEPGLDASAVRVTGEAVCRLAKLVEVTGNQLSPSIVEFAARAKGQGGGAWFDVHITKLSAKTVALTVFGETLEVDISGSLDASNAVVSELEIRAPMAGKVLEVKAKDGQTLEEGEVAFVVESMKMQLEVRAKSRVTVEKVLVQIGQVLTGPDTMAVLRKST